MEPQNEQRVFFDIPLGNMITQTKLENSVAIYDDKNEMEKTNIITHFNLIESGMNFDSNLESYLSQEFLDYICERSSESDKNFIRNYNEKLRLCSSTGTSIPGMPSIVLYGNQDILGAGK